MKNGAMSEVLPTADDAALDAMDIPPIIARRIACDARLQVAVEDAVGAAMGQRLDQRIVNRKLRRLLRRRDHGTCQFPGCGTQRRLHAHHVIHWEHGGPTELENLISLCHRHHRSVHEGGWNIIDKNSRFVFYDPQGHERRVRSLGRANALTFDGLRTPSRRTLAWRVNEQRATSLRSAEHKATGNLGLRWADGSPDHRR